MSTVLQKEHHRAIASLSLGMCVPDVARDSDVSVSTVYKWMNIPEFRSTLNMEIKQRQAAIDFQFQIMATESAESQLDAQRELRSITLRKEPADYARVMSMQITLKYGQRWADIAGYNVKLKDHKKLLIDLPDDPRAEPVPKVAPALAECAPGDRKNRPPAEVDPPHPTRGALTIEDIHDNEERIKQAREAARIEDEQRAREHRAQLRAAGMHAPEPEECDGESQFRTASSEREEGAASVARAAVNVAPSQPSSVQGKSERAEAGLATGCPCELADGTCSRNDPETGQGESNTTDGRCERATAGDSTELVEVSHSSATARQPHESPLDAHVREERTVRELQAADSTTITCERALLDKPAVARSERTIREAHHAPPNLVHFRSRDYDLNCCVPASDLFMPIRVRREYEKEQRRQSVANPKGS